MKRSSQSKRYVSIMGLLLAISMALFLFAGCSRNSVAADEQNPVDGTDNPMFETGDADQNYAAPPVLIDGDSAASDVNASDGGNSAGS